MSKGAKRRQGACQNPGPRINQRTVEVEKNGASRGHDCTISGERKRVHARLVWLPLRPFPQGAAASRFYEGQPVADVIETNIARRRRGANVLERMCHGRVAMISTQNRLTVDPARQAA